MSNKNIYQRADENGAYLETTCININQAKWDQLMKGARHANRLKVVRLAVLLGIADPEEIKLPYYNPHNHFITKTHIIYVHSAIEHFIKVN